MSVYAIGDVQGCYAELMALLEKIRFDESKDVLWFVGDLVNRGPQSLEVVRFVKSLGERAVTVLGNHDLHLLAVDAGFKKDKSDSMMEILDAPDNRELIDWLRCRPLLHHDAELDCIMVHAGLSPDWDLATAQQCAQELQDVLCSDNYHDFLQEMYGNEPRRWSEDLFGWDRLRYICNSFTRIRYCTPKGKLVLDQKGPPDKQHKYVPWFDVSKRKNSSLNIIFGHWSTLGRHHQEGVYAIDSGCVWGGKLTALELGTHPPKYITSKCKAAANPYDYL